MTEIMSRGGGVGINISSLRPHHAYVKGVNGRSSGSVSWGALYSFVTGLIEQGGSRRGALMLILNVWHPDILEFVNSKRKMGQITNANISVGITDDFMAAVRADGDWDLIFPDTGDPDYDRLWDGNLAAWQAAGKPVVQHKTVKARDIWQSIIESAWASAEPGLWFMDQANKMSNSWYFNPLISTNPCGEQPLPAWSVCNLGALNLARFVKDGDVDWATLKRAVRTAIRFLDNVIDDTPYFFEENAAQQLAERRVGLGTMGLAEMLIRLKIRYGSPESEQFLDRLYRFIASEAYLASADYAVEKGSFEKFEAEKFLQSGFIQGMPEEVRAAVREKGMRNVTLLTQAPTGTTGTMIGTSTGIEPYYFWSYYRKSRLGRHEEKVDVVAEWQAANPDQPLPDYFVTAMDLKPEDHVRVQAAIQRWVDSSISKTCNVPNEYTVDQVRELYELMYELGCKGGTIYRDGSRDEQVLHRAGKEDESKKENPAEGSKPASLTDIKARVRPTVLHGITYRKHTPVGTAYITINSNGSGDQQPFEIFINVSKVGSDVAADAEGLGRLISLILRMPSPLSPYERAQDVIAQLRGIGSGQQRGFGKQRVMSLADAVAQALAEHIGFHPDADLPGLPDEEDEHSPYQLMFDFPKGDICPSCGNAALLMIEGCKKCYSCGYSQC
jgi:ribonucleoside-diphosphate reductase alpha chain